MVLAVLLRTFPAVSVTWQGLGQGKERMALSWAQGQDFGGHCRNCVCVGGWSHPLAELRQVRVRKIFRSRPRLPSQQEGTGLDQQTRVGWGHQESCPLTKLG